MSTDLFYDKKVKFYMNQILDKYELEEWAKEEMLILLDAFIRCKMDSKAIKKTLVDYNIHL